MEHTTGSGNDVVATLRACRELRDANAEGLARLAAHATVHAYRKGERLLFDPATADSVGVLLSGRVRSVHFSADGRPLTMRTTGPGEVFGLLAALAGGDHQTFYEAVENDTRACLMPRDVFLEVARTDPEIMWSLIEVMARNINALIALSKSLAADVPARAATYVRLLLEEQAPEGNGPFEVDLGVSRVELAARLGTVPETLSRAFRLLADEGILESHGRHVVVLDRQALAEKTDGLL